VDPRAGLDDEKRRKPLTLPGLKLRFFAPPLVAINYTACAIPAPCPSLYPGYIRSSYIAKLLVSPLCLQIMNSNSKYGSMKDRVVPMLN
jgi:hypothetical protein